ncbi:hypothetical protein [Acidithiobacillus sp.]|uniref:hypothetical protein n=1 Tax=Acidithiobacillus sp. TaxID=1872118 RepID=UPI003D008F6A
MLTITPFNTLEAAGTAVLTLTEGLEKQEFLASRLTRAETRRQIHLMSASTALLSQQTQDRMAEIDWEGWRILDQRLGISDKAEDTLLWLAIRALVPDTLMWLRVYRKNQPEWFRGEAEIHHPTMSPSTGARP